MESNITWDAESVALDQQASINLGPSWHYIWNPPVMKGLLIAGDLSPFCGSGFASAPNIGTIVEQIGF